MASAAGGSGGSGGARCPSREKGTTPVGRRSKKPSAFHRETLRYLEKNIENVWQGARNLCLISRICCGVTVPHPQIRRFQLRHCLLGQLKIHQSILRSHARTVENLCVVLRIFKLHVCFWDVCVSFRMQSMYVLLNKLCRM